MHYKGFFKMIKKINVYLIISTFLTSFNVLAKIAEENVDCSDINKSFQRARLYLNATNKYSNEENGVGIL